MKIVIAGAGEVGSQLAKLLRSATNDITVIDSATDRLQALSSIPDVLTIEGNPTSIKVLKDAGIEEAALFIAVFPSQSQDVNILAGLLAKKLGAKKVVVRINNEEYLSYENKYHFTEMGIDMMIYPEKIAAGEVLDMLSHNFSASAMDFAHGKLNLSLFKLEDDSPLIDMTVQQFAQSAMGKDVKFRVVAISRGNDTIQPKPGTKFKFRDKVFIISRRDTVKELMNYVGAENIEINSVFIMGGSKIGEIVARELSKHVNTVKIVEKDKERCGELVAKVPEKVVVINGDGRNTELLVDENMSSFDAFIAVSGNSEANVLACVAAKKMGVGRTIAQVENLEYLALAEGMGVDAVINKKMITAGRIFRFTLSDKVKLIRYMSGTNAEIIEFVVAPGAKVTKGTLAELDFPEGAIIGGVVRGGDSFIAVGSTTIKEYDRVVVFAMPEAVGEIDKWFR